MKRQSRNSNESAYVPEVAVSRPERSPAISLARSTENADYSHLPPLPYSYSRSRLSPSSNRFTYDCGYEELPPVPLPFPSRDRVPQSNFLRKADMIADDPLQRWKIIEEDRDYGRKESRDFRKHVSFDSRQHVGDVPHYVPSYNQNDYGTNTNTTSAYVNSFPFKRDMAIVSPIFDDYGEQGSTSRNSVRSNEWDDLKPPPFTNDQLPVYHRNQLQREEESYYHRSTGDHMYGGRDYPSRFLMPQKSPVVPTAKMIEISPGSFVRLRGADETYNAVASDFYAPCQCMFCSSNKGGYRKGDDEPLFCIQDAEFFLCPNCKSVCPLEDSISKKSGSGGVGLGFTLQMLIQIQEEILANRTADK